MRGGFVRGLSAPDNPAQIIVWATMFGCAAPSNSSHVSLTTALVVCSIRWAAWNSRSSVDRQRLDHYQPGSLGEV
jgi:hypothetical protein